jgi:hypothetical protein
LRGVKLAKYSQKRRGERILRGRQESLGYIEGYLAVEKI